MNYKKEMVFQYMYTIKTSSCTHMFCWSWTTGINKTLFAQQDFFVNTFLPTEKGNAVIAYLAVGAFLVRPDLTI